MENHHFSWKKNTIVIFHSYIKLPEGTDFFLIFQGKKKIHAKIAPKFHKFENHLNMGMLPVEYQEKP